MPRPPKLSPAQWEKVRQRWEADPRDGYAWLIEEMKLPLTRPAIRQHAMKADPPWTKSSEQAAQSEGPVSTPGKSAKLSPKGSAESSLGAATRAFREGVKGRVAVPTGGRKFPAEVISPLADVTPATTDTVEGFKEPACMQDLEPNEALWVREYMKDRNAAAAAIRAGYSPKSARELGPRIAKRPRVVAALNEYCFALMGNNHVEGNQVLAVWSSQLKADPNEVVQHRRYCCRHCWGKDFTYQYTPSEFDQARIQHEDTRARIMGGGGADIGEFPGVAGDWYDRQREPNPECPECFGDGLCDVFVADTRTLSPEGRSLIASVKQTKEGIEVKLHDKQKAAESLARYHNLFNDTPDGGTAGVLETELAMRYVELMEKSRAMQQRTLAERGLDNGEEN